MVQDSCLDCFFDAVTSMSFIVSGDLASKQLKIRGKVCQLKRWLVAGVHIGLKKRDEKHIKCLKSI